MAEKIEDILEIKIKKQNETIRRRKQGGIKTEAIEKHNLLFQRCSYTVGLLN